MIVAIIYFTSLLIFYFISLWTVADCFLVKVLGTIVYLQSIPESIAGMTVIAFANGSPDVFSISLHSLKMIQIWG